MFVDCLYIYASCNRDNQEEYNTNYKGKDCSIIKSENKNNDPSSNVETAKTRGAQNILDNLPKNNVASEKIDDLLSKNLESFTKH